MLDSDKIERRAINQAMQSSCKINTNIQLYHLDTITERGRKAACIPHKTSLISVINPVNFTKSNDKPVSLHILDRHDT